MPEISKKESEEWRDQFATRELIRRVEEFRMQCLVGILAVSRDKRIEQVDEIAGIDLVIDMIKNIHKEVI